MTLTVKQAPVTSLSVPIPREDILEAIVVVRTRDGVEVAGALTEQDRCKNLLLDGLTRLQAQNPFVVNTQA